MIGPNFITDMMGFLSWVLAVIAIHWVLKEPFKARRKRIREYFLGRWERWKSHSGLKKTYFLLSAPVSILFAYILYSLFSSFFSTINAEETPFRDIAIGFFATLSGFGALFGFYTSIVRTETAEQGQITERLNKAIENLGKSNNKKPVVEVRLGALYALERIAKDSIRDHVQIMEIICAYIRHNSQWSNRPSQVQNRQEKEKEDEQKDTKNEQFKTEEPSEDIQAALTIIGRRKGWPEGRQRLKIEKQQRYRIDLSNCDLHNVRIEGANLCGALFLDSNLTNAFIIDTDLTDARICMSDMTGVWFNNVEMKNTDTVGSFAYEGDFLGCKNFIQKQLDIMFLGENIKLRTNLKHPQKKLNIYKKYNTFYDFMDAYSEWLETL